ISPSVIRLRKRKSFKLSNILNMDETPVWFDMVGNFTIDQKDEKTIYISIIPSGLTSICQPLDIAINKLFKDNLRKEWYLWMAKGGARKTAAGNL
ncbi:5844_t:CDS:2, partial [Scutellospora calospora]